MRISIKHLAFCLCAILLPVPALAEGKGEVEEAAKERLERVLSAFEIIPTRDTLLGIHPQVERMLREVASGKTRRVLARNRAITMLQYFPGKKNEALLAGILNSKCKKRDGLCLVNQQQALASYAAVKGPGSLAMIRPFLAHDNLDTRMAAAQALRLSRSPKTIPLLAERLTVEKSATVKAEIEQQIRRLEHAEKKLPQRRIPGQ